MPRRDRPHPQPRILAKLVIIGKHSADEKSTQPPKRVLNVEQYLTEEKGIDASRIQLRTGGDSGRTVEKHSGTLRRQLRLRQHRDLRQLAVKRHGQPYSKSR